jgi:hypothetical protein
MGTTEQHLTEHPWDVFGPSTGGARCTHESFQLEEIGSHRYVVSTSQYHVYKLMDVPVPSLLQWWKCLETGMDQSAETFEALSARLKSSTKRWLKAERKAQQKRSEDCSVMDIYDMASTKHKPIDNGLYGLC